ncbi:hypothetical protein L2U69_13400 [Zavarzinia compransoris]|uniref:hypothetical protein n=1 Tax=Zavarzinia marina TaxID=2911065 RepID=UPI001F239083|nr:hypothetical protein [Zavarzinia marina]MCF4166644.1 hypothetical protein [Zavarzinia marina]
MANWRKVVFLHVGWAGSYDGSEAPEGGHAYLKNEIGVENQNFRAFDGWCFGYAPVARTAKARGLAKIPVAMRTLNITKLGALPHENEVSDITVVWTAKRPYSGPVVVGLYDRATVLRYMPPFDGTKRVYIAKARAEDCRLVPKHDRIFSVIHKQKGFPGMAAAWFPGEHDNGPAHDFLENLAEYLPVIRKLAPVSAS